MNTNELFGPKLGRLQQYAVVAAIIGAVLCGIGYVQHPERFFYSYLFAYLFWFGVTLGSLAWLLVHHVTGGGWGFILRRLLEAGTKNLPVFAILFLPMAFGMKYVYAGWWDHSHNNHHWEHFDKTKQIYLSAELFWARFVLYFVIWIGISTILNKWSRQQNTSDDPHILHKMNMLAAPSIVIYVLTLTFAIWDWVMSITPWWNSSLFGVIFLVGQGLSTLALMSALISGLAGDHPLVTTQIPRRFFRDIGNLMLAFTLLWGYTNVSQWLIIWSGNISEEAMWYVPRTDKNTGWLYVGAFLIVCHFFLPFFTLLSSSLKVKMGNLAKLAVFIILMRHLDLMWYIVPSEPTRAKLFTITPADIGAPLFLGGIWLAFWALWIKGQELVPLRDPRLIEHWPLKEVAEHV